MINSRYNQLNYNGPWSGWILPWEPEDEKLKVMQQRIWKFFCEDAAKYDLIEREGQQNMALDIGTAIENKNHLIVEAGVGIGKSFAYIVPLLFFHKQFKQPVIISTSTITLQEQLVKDIKSISDKIKYPIQVVVAKGQTNYICLKRVDELQDTVLKERILPEIASTRVERKDFTTEITNEQWNKIRIDRFGKKTCENCIHKQNCHFELLRKEMKKTNQIIVCNHDLLTMHLQKTVVGNNGLLPEFTPVIVIDEAHNLEDKVRSSLTMRHTQQSLMKIVNMAVNSVPKIGTDIEKNTAIFKNTSKDLFRLLDVQILAQIENKIDQIDTGRFFFDKTSEITKLMSKITRLLKYLNESVQIQMTRFDSEQAGGYGNELTDYYSNELIYLAESFEGIINTSDNIIWLEKPSVKAALVLCACPGDIPREIKKLYFDDSHISILTSATLTNQKQGNIEDMYRYLIDNIGFPIVKDSPTSLCGDVAEPKDSPFPYEKNAMIYYATDLPHPTHDRNNFLIEGSKRIVELLKLSNGRALILFTAKSDMDNIYDQLISQNLPHSILKQNEGSSQDNILLRFKDEKTSVLLGTGAFWEGIDIPGETLTNVIIFKLPFPVPDPIIKNKCDKAKDKLLDVLAPEMIIKLKQGIGRLIRSEQDVGIISIIDPRLADEKKAPYIDIVWNALPIKNKTNNLDELSKFYQDLFVV